MAAENGEKTVYGKKSPVHSLNTVGVNNFAKKWLENDILKKWPEDSADILGMGVKNFTEIALFCTI